MQKNLISPYPINIQEAEKVERRDVRPPKPPKPFYWTMAENIGAGAGFYLVWEYGLNSPSAWIVGVVATGILMIIRYSLDEPSELVVRVAEGVTVGIKSPVMAAQRMTLYIDNVQLTRELTKAEKQVSHLKREVARLRKQQPDKQTMRKGDSAYVSANPMHVTPVEWEDPYGNDILSDMEEEPATIAPPLITDARVALAYRLLQVYRDHNSISRSAAMNKATPAMTKREWETARDYMLAVGILEETPRGGHELSSHLDDVDAEEEIRKYAEEQAKLQAGGMVTP